VREGFIYSKHIARRTKCGTIHGLEIIMGDQEVVRVQALGTSINGGPRSASNFEHPTVHSWSATM
jgi:hypothetical protein